MFIIPGSVGQEQLLWLPSSSSLLWGVGQGSAKPGQGGRKHFQDGSIAWHWLAHRFLATGPLCGSSGVHMPRPLASPGARWGRDRRGEGKTKQKLQCLYEQLHPFIATLSRRSSCNVTETTERQRSEHREGRTTEARLGASCPTTMEGLLPSYCPPPLPCKRAIRKTEAVIGFFLERTDQPQSLMILNIPQIFINCKENWATSLIS